MVANNDALETSKLNTAANTGAAIESAIFPGLQGGPLMHVIAAKAVAFQEALSPEFKTYQQQVLKNADALAKALKELPDRVAKNGLRAAVYAGAKVIRDEAKLQAPVATGDLGPNQPPPGTLKRSVILKQIPELSNKNKQTFFVTVRHGKKYRKQGKKGNLSQDAWYWRFVEFGTVKMSARPFLRPAFDMKKNDALTAIKTRLAERIEQAARELKK